MLNAKLFSSVNIHREAVDWHNRVLTNGGRVSKDTVKAVSDFCYRIDAAGIRAKFSRLNLICGDNLNAARVPLYRGLSFTGTQYGNSIDTNNNFVSGDYTERGSNGGLNAGSGGTKYLDTGVIPNNTNGFTGINNHMSMYVMNRLPSGAIYIGMDDSYGCCAGSCTYMYLVVEQNGSASAYIIGDNDNGGNYTGQFFSSSSVGLFLGCCDTGESGANSFTYTNGASDNDYTYGDMNSNSLNGAGLSITIFGYNHIALDEFFTCGLNDTYGTGHISSYSFGPFLTYDQQLSYYNALQAFQTALGRNK